MNKIISWAKRPVNANFLLLFLLAVVLAFLALGSFIYAESFDKNVTALGGRISDSINGEMEDVEGYGAIINSIAYGFGIFGSFLIKLLYVIIPLFISLIIIVQAIFTRLIFTDKTSGGILCYRIFMAISLLIITVLLFLYGFVLALKIVFAVFFYALFIAVLTVCIINTYTKIITKNKEMPDGQH